MGIFTKAKSKLPKFTPLQRLALTLWTFAVVVLTLIFFRRFGVRILMLSLVLVPLVGLLFGMRMLDKFDRLAKSLGLIPAEPKPPPPSAAAQFSSFKAFLRSQRDRGEFTRQEFRSYCDICSLEHDTFFQLGLQKGWFREMGGAMVITSTGMEILEA